MSDQTPVSYSLTTEVTSTPMNSFSNKVQGNVQMHTNLDENGVFHQTESEILLHGVTEDKCSNQCMENGALDHADENTIADDLNCCSIKSQMLTSTSIKCVDSFKIDPLVIDSDGNPKYFHKFNGLSHNDHNSGDNGFMINLKSVCGEEAVMPVLETQGDSSECDSIKKADNVLQCIHPTDCVAIPLADSHIAKQPLESSQHHCKKGLYSEEVDVLLTEIERTTLSNSNVNCGSFKEVINGIVYEVYESEKQMPDIMRLITKDLSEPYSIYTYRYFIHNWPKLCFLAMADNVCVGAIVCKLDLHKKMVRRGYIAMLAVDSEYRRRQIGSSLVTKAIEAMIRDDCDEVVLETEITNQAALHLYENLGFVRDKRLFRYYLNGVDALRLKLWLR
ncbi:unnamed protein product [Lymnaea stagnalis]|uniref:N-terminal methionine N(alpha)-acetyltransferase NatC n=1 Tax=Lymnaea stagnalis TaxID=6523 RepID=A0AAV2IIT4_LYMST